MDVFSLAGIPLCSSDSPTQVDELLAFKEYAIANTQGVFSYPTFFFATLRVAYVYLLHVISFCQPRQKQKSPQTSGTNSKD